MAGSIVLGLLFFLFLQCGRPVEVKVCPECKVQIGGAGYHLSQGNTAAQRYGMALYVNRSVTWVNTLSAVCLIERWFENVFATSQTLIVFVDFFNGTQIMLN